MAYVADLQDMCEELQAMQSTMTEQHSASTHQACPAPCIRSHPALSAGRPSSRWRLAGMEQLFRMLQGGLCASRALGPRQQCLPAMTAVVREISVTLPGAL